MGRLASLVLLAAAALALGACTMAAPSRPATSRPRAQCLVDPRPGTDTPLVYLLCIQSP